jgi:hypothetical protein
MMARWAPVCVLLLLSSALSCSDDASGASGENTLQRCTDGLDNDGDGHVDCADQDCLVFAVCSQPDGGGGGDADAADGADDTGDTGEDSEGDGAPEVVTVCGDGHEWDGDWHPIEGVSKVVLTAFAADESAELRLLGPVSVRSPMTSGCWFVIEPGTYTLQLWRGGAVSAELEVELPEERVVLLAAYSGPDGSGAIVEPLDLSVPAEGSWRFVIAHVAQDNLETPLDIWAYPPGDTTGEGTPERVVQDLAPGASVTTLLPAQSYSFEYQPSGTQPDGLYLDRFAHCGADAAVLSLLVISCDTHEIYDETACHGYGGGFRLVVSLDDQPCL